MESFQVIEAGEGIERAILRKLGLCGKKRSAGYAGAALLVVSPAAVAHGIVLPKACHMALLPGDAGGRGNRLRAASAVSYGLSPRDSLTISSREEGAMWVALQRELVTLGGQVVERQEFCVALEPEIEELSTLAVVGALILLGVEPEKLERGAAR